MVNKWLIARVFIIAFSSVASLVAPVDPNSITNAGWEIAIAGFLFFPVIAAVGLFIVFLIPNIQNSIGKPDWSKNPFDFSTAEQFFHLGGYVIVFSGLGTIVARLTASVQVEPEHIAPVTFGLGILVGLAMLTFKKTESVQ